ncbi:MAG: hypothetical protein A2Z88_00700 [Omnitrophica WOR_2 bacterium GWA2_47_8]|nr:MAG: hypothetical protein A2Z88_00700 [Omnitrophica WOR_2 bacterium GWA2_47_8]
MPDNEKRKNLLALFLGIILSLFLLEVLLPHILPLPDFMKITVDGLHGDGQYILTEDPTLIYVPKPKTGEFNEQAYRGKVFSIEKPKGVKRILILGDSVTEGIKLPPEQRFSALLNEKLGTEFEVINLAVPGYNVFQEIEYFKIKGLAYQPDAVIFAVTFNDLDISQRSSGELVKISEKLEDSPLKNFYKIYYSSLDRTDDKLLKSNSYRYLKYLVLSFFKPEPFLPDAKNLPADDKIIKNSLLSVKELSHKYNFKLNFVLLPVNTNVKIGQMRRLEAVLQALQIPTYDFDTEVNATINRKQKKGLFIDGTDYCHFNRQGHTMISYIFYQNIDRFLP